MLSSFSSCSASISTLGHTDGAYVEDVSGVARERYLLARWEPNTVNYTSCLSSHVSPREMAGQGKLGICQRTILLERWWTFKCMSGEKGQFSIKRFSTQWCVNHGILHSLLLGWQILYKQKQENVPYQEAFLDKSLVLSPPPPPALYTRLSVSDRLEVLIEIKIKRGRGCIVKFAFGRWIKVTFPFKSN